MRVVDVTGFFSSACGGIKTYYQAKAAYLPGRGVECHFIAPGAHNGSEPFGGGTLHRVAGPLLPVDANYRLFGDLSRLCRLVAELDPDIVEVASHYLLPLLVARGLRRARRRPEVIGFYHTDIPNAYVEPPVRSLPRPVRQAVMGAAWRWVRERHSRYRRTFVASRVVARMLEEHGIPGVTWVGLGVDTETFHPGARGHSAGGGTVAFTGRLTYEKGFSTLLSAWNDIATATGANLVVAGAGPLAPRIPRRPDVRYLGYIADRAALARIHASVDLVIVPGPYETFSLTTAEALSSGTPVVCSDTGAAAELVADSGCGAHFAARDPRSLAAAVISLLRRTPDERAALGRNGRVHIETRFTWAAVCERILAAYSS